MSSKKSKKPKANIFDFFMERKFLAPGETDPDESISYEPWNVAGEMRETDESLIRRMKAMWNSAKKNEE